MFYYLYHFRNLQMCSMYFDHTHPQFPPPTPPRLPLFPSQFYDFFIFSPLSQISAVHVGECGPSTEVWLTCQGSHPSIKKIPSFSSHHLPIAPQPGWGLGSLSLMHAGILIGVFLYRWTQLLWVHMCDDHFMPERHCFALSSPTNGSYKLSAPVPQCFLKLGLRWSGVTPNL